MLPSPYLSEIYSRSHSSIYPYLPSFTFHSFILYPSRANQQFICDQTTKEIVMYCLKKQEIKWQLIEHALLSFQSCCSNLHRRYPLCWTAGCRRDGRTPCVRTSCFLWTLSRSSRRGRTAVNSASPPAALAACRAVSLSCPLSPNQQSPLWPAVVD